MKKTFKVLSVVLCMFLFMTYVNASEKMNQIKEEVLKETYAIEANGANGISTWTISEYINNKLKDKFTNYSFYVNTCEESTKTCDVSLYDDDTYESDNFEIAIKPYGLIVEDGCIWELQKGQSKKITYRFVDADGNEKQVSNVDYYYDDDKLDLTSNVVKVLDDGYANVEMVYRVDGKEHWYDILILSNVESSIAQVLDAGSIEYVIEGEEVGNYEYGLQRLIVSKALRSDYITYSTSNDNTTHSGNVYNIDFEVKVGNKKYAFKKDNFTVIPRGYSLVNAHKWDDIEVAKGETFQIEYELYDDSITFTSVDSNIATVTSGGLITGVKSGITFVCAKTNKGYGDCLAVKVAPDDEFKASVSAYLSKVPDSIQANLISNLTDEDGYDLRVDYVGAQIDKYLDSDEVYVSDVVYDGNDTHAVNFCLMYTKEYRNNKDYYNYGYFESSELGNPCKTITVTYADEDGRVSAEDLNKGKELAKIFDGKEFPSYLDKSLEDYMKIYNGGESSYWETFVKNANLDQYLAGNAGYSFELDGRAGNSEFGSVQTMGFGLIKKNGITVAIANIVKVYQTMDLNVAKNASKEAFETSLINSVKSSLKNSNAKVELKELESDREGLRLYRIAISSGSDLNNNAGSSPLLTKAGFSEGKMVIRSYVEATGAEEQTQPQQQSVDTLTSGTIGVVKNDQNSVTVSIDNYYSNQKYTLYKSTNKKKWSKVGVMSGNSYETKINFGQKTYFRVTVELGKKKVNTNTVDIKVLPDAAGELRIVSAGAKNIKLDWDKSGYTGYELQRSTKPTSGFKKVTFLTKNSKISYNNTKLKNATTYYYRVRPYKTVKGKKVYGGFSNVVSATTGPATPKKPSIKATNYNTITLNIKSAKTASYYEVSRSTNKKKGYTTIAAITELSYVDTVDTGTTYYYKTRACNAAGVCSGWTGQVNKKTGLSKPTLSGVPEVTVTLDENSKEIKTGKVTLTVGAVDGATGYVIQRSTKKNKGFKNVTETTELTSEDTGVKAGKTYYYRVRSYRLVGTKKVYSGYTKPIKVVVK